MATEAQALAQTQDQEKNLGLANDSDECGKNIFQLRIFVDEVF